MSISWISPRSAALALSVAAIAAAGCGSSSKSKSTAAPAAPSTPSTPAATSTTTSTGGLSASTPITDPTLKKQIVAAARQTAPAHVTTAQLNQITDCVIKKYQAEGVKTAGDLAQHATQAGTFGKACAQQLGIK